MSRLPSSVEYHHHDDPSPGPVFILPVDEVAMEVCADVVAAAAHRFGKGRDEPAGASVGVDLVQPVIEDGNECARRGRRKPDRHRLRKVRVQMIIAVVEPVQCPGGAVDEVEAVAALVPYAVPLCAPAFPNRSDAGPRYGG